MQCIVYIREVRITWMDGSSERAENKETKVRKRRTMDLVQDLELEQFMFNSFIQGLLALLCYT